MNLRPEVEEEADIIFLTGGEIPEVVYYESFKHLLSIGVTPSPRERARLLQAVADRYAALVRRDLSLENRDQSHFRGPARAAVNFRRFKKFTEQHGLDSKAVRILAARWLRDYLEQEAREIEAGRKFNTLGQTADELIVFLTELDGEDLIRRDLIDRVTTVETYGFKKTIAAMRRSGKKNFSGKGPTSFRPLPPFEFRGPIGSWSRLTDSN